MVNIDGLRRVDPGHKQPGNMRFSKTELMHILLAVLVLTLAFTIVMYRGSHLDDNEMMNIIKIFGVSLVVVTCSFLVHELGHKYVAQSYGVWSEFRAYPMGLLIALMFSVFGFLFAAPGAVYIRGYVDKEANGKISLAGPATNFAVAALAMAVCLMTSGLTYDIFFMLAYLNAFLGLFNLIPIPPFDGSKIIAWSVPVFVAIAMIGIVEMALTFIVF